MTTLTSTDTVAYTYGNTDWKDQLTSFDGQAITYDAIGNPLSYRGMTLTWQNGRQLATLSKDGLSASYTYNDAGLRLSKTINGTTTEYYWNGTQLLAQKTGITYLYFLYDETGSAVGYKYNNKTYIYVKNLQGDVISVIDGTTGTAVATYTYDSWGNILTATGTMAEMNPVRYRGYYYDTETSLYYLQSRYYDAQTHRFVNADDIIRASISGSNMYGYCTNDPIMKADQSGHIEHFSIAMLDATRAWRKEQQQIEDDLSKIYNNTYGKDYDFERDEYLEVTVTKTEKIVSDAEVIINNLIIYGLGALITIAAPYAGFSVQAVQAIGVMSGIGGAVVSSVVLGAGHYPVYTVRKTKNVSHSVEIADYHGYKVYEQREFAYTVIETYIELNGYIAKREITYGNDYLNYCYRGLTN